MKKTLLVLFLFLSGCANQDFPFCCNATGTADVPYTTTYHFELAAGFANVSGSQNFLSITSQGDLQDLRIFKGCDRALPNIQIDDARAGGR